MKNTRRIPTICLIIVLVLSLFPMTAFAAGPTASATVKGNDVTITVKDGDATVTGTGQFEKNATKTYEFEGYTVKVEYNGNGVKSATVTGFPASGAPAAPPLASDTNAPAPKPGVSTTGGDMTWNGNDQAAAKAFVQSTAKDKEPPKTALKPVASKRTDASGDKISSNAHSGDFPGIYFYWNDKQKDDGILKVDPAVFDLFKDGKFYITAKNSNAYWDYNILPGDGKATSEGYLLYQIPRYFMYADKNSKTVNDELKNINMIFIGGDYKDAFLTIEKKWFDEDGGLVTDGALIEKLNGQLAFSSNAGKLDLGKNTIKITDFTTASLGKKVVVTEGAVKGYVAKQNPLSATVKWSDDPVQSLVFENQKQKAKITIKKDWDLLPGTVAPKATFTWGPLPYDEDAVYTADEGATIEVKEGGYWFEEAAIEGFTADKGYQELTAEAGGKYTVAFKNKEDRATLTIVKEWDAEALPEGSELPAAAFTDGYGLGTVTVKAGTGIAFEEEAIDETSIIDGWAYTYEFDYVTVDGARSDVNDVVFKAEKDKDHVVVFHNKVVGRPLPANVTVVKNWVLGDLPKTEKAILKSMLKFDPDFDFVLGEAQEVPAGTELKISEIPIDWSYDASTATHEIIYTIDCDTTAYEVTAAAGGEYVFTFTNTVKKSVTEKPAYVLVNKVWTGCFEEMPPEGQQYFWDKLYFDKDFVFVLGESKQVDAGTELNISEKAIEGLSYTESYTDKDIIYTVEWDTSHYSGTATPGSTVKFNIVNNVVKEVVMKTAQVTVKKVWKDAAGNEVANQGFLAEMNGRLSFTNGFGLGGNEVGAGPVAFAENQIASFKLGAVGYTAAFKSVEVAEDGAGLLEGASSGPAVSFDAEAGKSYTVTFVNEVDTAAITADDKIPSTAHYDRWWGYGILCYSSNTTAEGDFFVAFEPGFWDKYEYAKIGFGTPSGILYYAYFTKDSYTLQDLAGHEIQSGTSYIQYTIPSAWKTKYFDGTGYMGENLQGVWIVNPYGSGSQQAHRLEVKPLAGASFGPVVVPPLDEDPDDGE